MLVRMNCRAVRLVVLALLAVGASACGKPREVTVSSAAYAADGVAEAPAASFLASAEVAAFKLCVSRIRLIGKDGQAIEGGDGSGGPGSEKGEIRFAPGLIDVGSGKSVDWGKVSIPVGYEISGMRIKVHKDKELCGVDYSMLFQKSGDSPLTTSQDVEFKFAFSPVVRLDESTERLEVALAEIIDSLAAADLASLKSRVEAVESSCSAQ